MANIQELIQRAEAIRDEQSVNANTAERIGSWDLDMALLHEADIKRVIDFVTAEMHKYDAAEAERMADEIKRKAAEIARMQNEAERQKAELLRGVKIAEMAGEIGNLAGLNTEDKSSLVNAINEVERKAQGGGSKPVGGWAKTDLSTDVQASLTKADNALPKTTKIPTKTSDITNDSGYITSAALSGLETSAHASATYQPKGDYATSAELGSKQDTITDLETIRSGAAKGATAVQPVEGKGLSSNDYTNEDKQKLSGLGEAVEKKYEKPDSGIPSTDLTEDLRTSISRAETIYNDYVASQNLM